MSFTKGVRIFMISQKALATSADANEKKMIEILKTEQKEIIRGYKARFVHTQNVTLAFWEVEKGAALPLHSHIHEQTTQVLEGRYELTIGDETQEYTSGLVAVIPSNVLHGGVALTDCKLFDIFAPVREDYK